MASRHSTPAQESATERSRPIDAPLAYLRDTQGEYRLAKRTLPNAPVTIDIDDESVVQLRHERSVVSIAGGAAFGIASLAIPMSVHGELDGFLLVADKPDGAVFRSDELNALSEAAHRVIGNLESLRVAQLDRENAELKERIGQLQQAQAAAALALQAAEHARMIADLKLASLQPAQ